TPPRLPTSSCPPHCTRRAPRARASGWRERVVPDAGDALTLRRTTQRRRQTMNIGPAAVDPGDGEGGGRWRRPDGLVSLGRQQGSGLREPSFLVRRGDGQVVQLSPLLHLI